MSQRLPLDPASFETLLVAAWVLQCQHERETRNLQTGPKQSSLSWPVVRQQADLGTASVDACAWRASQAPLRAHAWLSSGVASTARYGQSMQTESARRYLSASQSFWSSAPGSTRQELRRITTRKPFSGLSQGALGQGLRRALLSLLNAGASAKNRLDFFAKYRVKVRITPSAGRAAAVLLIVAAFTLFEVLHQRYFNVVAAISRMDHQSQSGIRKPDPLILIPPVQVSHRRVTDWVVSSAVKGLSRYEVRALRRQAYYGDDTAALIMGMLYETGRYVPQSCTKAAEWVTRSANWGNAAAQYNLGLRYRDGDGLIANKDEAEKWLQKAADQRYSKAKLALEALTSRDARSTYAP